MPSAAAAAGFLLSFLSVAAIATSPGPHIAELNVLLPPLITSPVGYRLQGSDGCFSWSWDHHDILSLQPEYNSSSRCSTSARLMSIAPYSGRKETAVYATDRLSGVTIRCKVFIDKISRIQIFHHSVKIDLDELAALRIRAFDDEENVFSSLVGLKFLWQLEPKSPAANIIHRLVHVPLKETPLSDCGGFCGDLETQIEMEDRGFGSDLFVVKGTEIGHEVVSAQLLEPQLEHVTDKIILTVAEAMSLDPPSPLFVTVSTSIYYSLRVIRLNTPKVINLPSRHHRWSVINSTVAEVDSEMGIAYALNLGITNIVVEDTRLSGHLQTSCLHVVIPDKLSLSISPVSEASDPLEGTQSFSSSIIWYVFPGQEYIINMRVFSEGPDPQEIYITENTALKLESSTPKYWDILLVTDELSVTYDRQKCRLLKPISEGRGVLTASLRYHSGSDERWEVLTVCQEVIVCSKVKINVGGQYESSQVIRLPWAPGVYQEIELRASGGCGRNLDDYVWFSSNEAVVSVSTFGLLRTENPGQAVIKVVSVFDSLNYEEVVVEVSIPSSMVMLPNFPVESVIGTQLEASVAMKTSHGDYYFKCDAFNSFVRWKIFSDNENFKVLNTTMKEGFNAMLSQLEGSNILYAQPCAWTHLYASAAGRAMLHATMSTELQPSTHSKDGLIILKAVSSLAAYSPLVVRQAGNGNQFGGYWVDLTRTYAEINGADITALSDLYLVPGSWIDVQLLGGPERWDQNTKYIETTKVTTEQDEAVRGGILLQSSGERLYRVSCEALGKFKLHFSRGNLVGEGHPAPAIASVELLVICSFPSSITLIANEPENRLDIIEAAAKADRGPGRIRSSPVTVANGCTIRLSSVGIHASGKAFANASSLSLRWELLGCEDLAHWSDSLESSAWERFLLLHNASGLCTVRATVTGSPKANHFGAKEYLRLNVENGLTDAMLLQLVSTLRIIPESVLLVFDPEAMVKLSVTGGTCFLDAVVNDTEVAQLRKSPEGLDCSHLVLGARGLGSALVTVWDIGLSPPAAASALVTVSNVEWLKLISDEEISIMEGITKTFEILAGAQDGSIFDNSQYMYMNIQVHIDESILELVSMNTSSRHIVWIISSPHFSIKALVPGITTLSVSVRQRYGHEISSQMIKVEVYRPLHLYPDYLYLAPGASYVLVVKGGPTRGAQVEYASMDEVTALIHGSSGRVSALSIGNATVRATVLGSGGTVLCEAFGRIEVGIPSEMILHSQSDRLCIGCRMPIFPSFKKGKLFSFYEVCTDYKWTVDDMKVMSFQTPSPLHPDDNDNAFINILTGRSSGRTKVSISFFCDFESSGIAKRVSYSASGTLTVVSDLPLALGMPITWILPPFYTSSDRLPAPMDSYVQSQSPDRGSISYSVLKACGRSDLSKQDAITIDGRKIKTRGTDELACIEAKDQATGRVEVASCIRTAKVAQVRASRSESVSHVAYLAKDAKLDLVVSYCDDLGYPFSEANGVVPLDVETNYPDVVSIQVRNDVNKTDRAYGNIFLQARSPGRALVMVSIKQKPEKVDFILVSVGAQLYPLNSVIHVGNKLNLTIIGDDDIKSGAWLSSNESVLAVNSASGEVHGQAEGSAQVIFKASNLKLQATVTVLNVKQIIVDSPLETLTNAPFPSEGYKFSVKFSDPVDSKFEANGKDAEVLYDCRVDPPFVGYAKSWRNHLTGSSYCLFFPYPPKHLLNSMSASKEKRSELYVKNEGFMYISIVASLRETPQVIGVAHALFVGGFSVENVGKLNLTPNTNKTMLRIIGNTDVEIYWNSKDLLLVTPLRTEGPGISGVREYKVEGLKDQKFTDKLIIVLPTTGQRVEIEVNFEPQGERNGVLGSTGFSGITGGAITVCAVVLLLTVLIFMRLLNRPHSRTSMRSARVGTPLMSSPVAAAGGSPVGALSQRSPSSATTSANSIQSSPGTQSQPFVEYVRRTIDETPYYKRNERRRFDPQYTY